MSRLTKLRAFKWPAIAWEVIVFAVVQQFSGVQVFFIALGLVVIALAAYLWTTDFRVPQLPTRHVSHA